MTKKKYSNNNIELLIDEEDKRQFFVDNKNVGYYFAVKYPVSLSLDESVSDLLEQQLCHPDDVIFELGYITIFKNYREQHMGSYLLGLALKEAFDDSRNDYFKVISINPKIINNLAKIDIYPSYVGESCCDYFFSLEKREVLSKNVSSYLENYNFS